QYGMGTSLARAMSGQNVAQKAAAYEMESEFVDGMDVLAMRRVTQRAIKRARENYLPTLIEARTYRYMGHSMSDPGNYRTRAEIEKYQERDPIKIFTADLKENGLLTDQDIAEIEARVKEEVESSVRFAEESPEPDPSELYTNVYANPIEI
ncbi:MAG TPA: thiamine pyrophosphate-dependent enzyme, partial [Pyrinomonadaceae bacterium]|nr:thiamine pyrophosphate-dependent enzyme [Pyrinomonadaceae bacterium]